MEVEVIRNIDNGTETLGSLNVISNGAVVFKCDTLELPYKDNKQRISCVPKGVYSCLKRGATSAIPYEHILIENVPNRSGVCIHIGNYYTDILGCILVGNGFSDLNKDAQKDLLNSKNTFKKLMAILPKQFKITVK